MFCGNCGAKLDDKNNFCTNCGAPIKNDKSNDCIKFGNYWQDKNEKTPIEWIVLEKKEDKILLISKYCLDYKEFNTGDDLYNGGWANSSLKEWLNTHFFNEAFSDNEKQQFIEKANKVFLLSREECIKYFGETDSNDKNKKLTSKATKFAIKNGCILYKPPMDAWEYGCCSYWLRSTSGIHENEISIVGMDGKVNSEYGDIVTHKQAVRPVIWIKN